MSQLPSLPEEGWPRGRKSERTGWSVKPEFGANPDHPVCKSLSAVRASPPLARRGIIVFVLLLLCPVLALAQETPIPDSPTRWVTDTVGFMPPDAAARLDARLQAYEQETGHQLLVYIGATTGDAPIEDWAVRAFEKWKVGRKGIDDGLVLFVMSEDRRLRIEVGYGLEDEVPDAIAFRVINETITPGFRAGDVGGAITSAMEQLAEAIGMPLPGAAPQGAARRDAPQPLTLLQLIIFAIIGLVFLSILATNPSLAIWLLANVLAGGGGRHRGGWGGGGGGRGWGGGGGGGFSGGGGRSGGGGASGSW